jgi:hypothetical protein
MKTEVCFAHYEEVGVYMKKALQKKIKKVFPGSSLLGVFRSRNRKR